MLTSRERNSVWRRASLYDHDWRFWAAFLGEPFLVRDHLVYFDGLLLHICAFGLSAMRTMDLDLLIPILREPPWDGRLEALRLWGQLDESLKSGGLQDFGLIEWANYDGIDCDVSIDIPQFSYAKNRRARLARNAARNQGLHCRAVDRRFLTADHIDVLRDWVSDHEVSRAATHIAAVAAAALLHPHVNGIEVFRRDRVVAFAIVSEIGKSRGALLQSFSGDLGRASRAGDSVMIGALELAGRLKWKTLHLGYSGSRGVLRFKEKWGGAKTGPGYQVASFARTVRGERYIRHGSYPWALQLQEGREGRGGRAPGA